MIPKMIIVISKDNQLVLIALSADTISDITSLVAVSYS